MLLYSFIIFEAATIKIKCNLFICHPYQFISPLRTVECLAFVFCDTFFFVLVIFLISELVFINPFLVLITPVNSELMLAF